MTSISIPVCSSTDRRPSHQTTPWVWEASIISTTTVEVGLSTSGRANSACALSGTTSSASTPGQITGPPAEKAYAVDPVGVATSIPSQAQRDSGRPSTSTSTSSIRSRAAFSIDTSLIAYEDQTTSGESQSPQRDLDGEALLHGVRAVHDLLDDAVDLGGLGLGQEADVAQVHPEQRDVGVHDPLGAAQDGAVTAEHDHQLDAVVGTERLVHR